MEKPILAMRVGGIVVDPKTQSPIVVLHGLDEARMYLPIFIGSAEAASIAAALAGLEIPRPMTHDLMVSTLAELSIHVDRVVVTDLIKGTFYAEITISDAAGHSWVLDARPSDGIALAVRTGASIYVARAVMEEAGGISDAALEPEEDGVPGPVPSPPKRSKGEIVPAGFASEQGAATPEAPPAEGPQGPQPVLDPRIRLEDLDPDLFGEYEM